MSTTEVIDETDGGKNPDRSVCVWCGQPIAWDDWCYVHTNGWADCGTIISGGTRTREIDLGKGVVLKALGITEFILDPDLIATLPKDKQTCAEPVEWAGWKLSLCMSRWWA